ncbi:YiiX/YebB-like N1pC/P60 family cysteine hydrolase [Amphritea sp.]|uniref:YiiX/YebB-like N1pC/P60 family cysteine hydrolase n=1 Tax=Amphritea sp. TaxID=1872502 RepID=UPI0025C58337|nr:YiiX/YebB-like N1pC/P60 family cysteine hydrolase [Amphritea sp.]
MKHMDINKLEKQVKYRLAEGDLIFSSIDLLVCRQVARETGSWSSHVGFAIKENNQWMIVESKVPFVCKTPLRRFLQRTRHGQIVVRRLKQPLSDDQIKNIKQLASNHIGKLYHPGFDFNSDRQFCSKLVYLIYKEAIGVELGTVQTLEQLLNQNPQARIGLWYFWYFGNIPWNRKTLSPASQLQDQQLQTVFSAV